jgi:hypothetical protein
MPSTTAATGGITVVTATASDVDSSDAAVIASVSGNENNKAGRADDAAQHLHPHELMLRRATGKYRCVVHDSKFSRRITRW